MKRIILALVCVAPITGIAVAQNPPPESVTVTADKSRQAVERFIKSAGAATRMTGKMARWETPICPYAVGIRKEAADFVVDRVKAVAGEVGAPVSASPTCKFNVEIVFTRTPQALLDNVAKEKPWLLGYHDGREQRARLATLTRPIQGLYVTATRDLHGQTDIDSSRTTAASSGLGLMKSAPYAIKVSVPGSRLSDGLRSTFDDIIIVADIGALERYELGAVSDYIAMLALTQAVPPQGCQSLPSITDLLTPGCAQSVQELTASDRGYLRGLYHMRAGLRLVVQKNEIAGEMAKAARE